MALPSSRERTYGPKPEIVRSADLNAIQDAIISLRGRAHGTYQRMASTYQWLSAGPTAAELNAGLLYWELASGERVIYPLRLVEGETLGSIWWFWNGAQASVNTLQLSSYNIAADTVSVISSLTPAATGWRQDIDVIGHTVTSDQALFLEAIAGAGGMNLSGARFSYSF